MSEAPAKRVVISPILYLAISALFLPRVGYAAVPPATAIAPEEKAGTSQPAAPQGGSRPGSPGPVSDQETVWLFPPVRWGGALSYDMRSSSGEGQRSMGRGLVATLRANSQGFIWQPWFARINGNLNLSSARSSASSTDDSGTGSGSSSRNLGISGDGQLNLLPFSRFPFEAHISRSENTSSSDLSVPVDYVAQRFGFSQQYHMRDGDAVFGYDHSAQSSSSTPGSRQDSVQLSLTKNLTNQHLQLTGHAANSKSDRTGDFVKQGSLTLQHNYGNGPVTLDNIANVTRSDYYLGSSQSSSRLAQVGTQAFWHASERPLSVSGGLRMLTISNSNNANNLISDGMSSQMRTVNANVGSSYDISQFFHVFGSANASVNEAQETRVTSASQSAGATYSPAPRAIGEFMYSWSVNGSATNQGGSANHARNWNSQFNHSVNRGFGPFTVDASQALSVSKSSGSMSGQSGLMRSISHSAGMGWSQSVGTGNAMVRASVSDSRSLDGIKEYFQMVNLQFSGNMRSTNYSSWSGNLTMQATRQGASDFVFATNENGQNMVLFNPAQQTTTTSSSGSVNYQHSRFFGVRNLRFSSDLRLNSQGLLPILGSPKDQETAAWESNLSYAIGRTLFRAGMIIARVSYPSYSTNPDGTIHMSGASRTNRAIMFTVQRSFGDF